MDLLTQHEAFLRAIFDAPDDDTPRLVYADFLQENGEEDRAELIRVQCELARLEGRVDKSSEERKRVLTQQQIEIAKRFPSPVQLHQRGFKRAWPNFRMSLDELLDTKELRGRAAYSTPELFAVESVELFGGRITSAEPFDVLFGLSVFTRVTWLTLCGREVADEATLGTDFTTFYYEPVITPAGVAALAQHRGLRRITELDLRNNDLDNDAARALVKSPYLDNLKRLQLLEGNRLRGKVWQQVIERFGEDVVG